MKTLRLMLLILLVITGIYRFILNFNKVSVASSINAASLMQKINTERANRNIPKLITATKLIAAATAKTEDMFARGYFDHLDPDGHYVWKFVEAAGYKPYRMLGENLAIDFSTEDGIIRAWINSPSHRDNMLNTAFADQGLNSSYGTFQNRYTNLVTSLFGTLAHTDNDLPESPNDVLQPMDNTQSATTTGISTRHGSFFISNSSNYQTNTSTNNSMMGKNEPAIALTPNPQTANERQNTSPEIKIITPKNKTNDEINFYETARTLFLVLIVLLIGSLLIDLLIRGRVKGLWQERNLGVFILIIMATLLTFNLY